MKLKRTIKIFALLLFMISSAQAQWNKGTLYFRNGDVKKGLVKFNGTEKIKYKSNKEAKKVKYHFADLEKLDLSGKGIHGIYVYLLLEENLYQVVKQMETGKVNLYSLIRTYYAPSAMPGTGGTMTMGNNVNINHLFVKAEGDEYPTHLGSNDLFSKNFKKAASEFFKDCPILAQKIQNKTYKKRDIQKIVAFYNQKCE